VRFVAQRVSRRNGVGGGVEFFTPHYRKLVILSRHEIRGLLPTGGGSRFSFSEVELKVMEPFEMEPKSIHTYLESDSTGIYAYDIDMRITNFPETADRNWLYYFALQVNFTDHDEWSHGGIQWSGEFRNHGNKGVNWGGGSAWAGYGGLGINNTPFVWECDCWYRFRVWKVEDDSEGHHRWLFAVLDYTSNHERQYGTIRTKSHFIRDAVVFTETGYGVQCDSPTARVEWRNPRFYTPEGTMQPERLVANYNGTCLNPNNTNQGLLSPRPALWFHETNTPRVVEPNKCLWQR
jgi:hypothetical protein